MLPNLLVHDLHYMVIMENFSTNALCMVLASESYNENDYIRNYKKFARLTHDS